MPNVSAPSKVLVTGANGYIGQWIVRRLLEGGYLVRVAVRSADKGDALVKLFAEKLPGKEQNIEVSLVEDITVEHAYDNAVQGVSAIIHTASPLTYLVDDPKDVIDPAVKGTLGLLQSAAEHGKDVKRIVVTSSIKAVLSDKPKTYIEEDWNDVAVSEIETKGKDARKDYIYDASKTLAEKAAWKLYEENESKVSWDLTTIQPGWVYGPTNDDPESPMKLPGTMLLFWHQFFVVRDPAHVMPPAMNYVDVRDVADMHVQALQIDKAGGERFICTSQWCTWQDWLNTARDLNLLPALDKGDPAKYPTPSSQRICSNEKAKKILGTKFRSFPETLKDILEQFRPRGWLTTYESQ
ncbi:NAD(P)-binding protein [Cubamyces menziesii]|nr:NAD(P)-binding protein [Cubamyces menziesii]